jgi:hypothetical protein
VRTMFAACNQPGSAIVEQFARGYLRSLTAVKRRWQAGTRLIVEDLHDGVFLMAASLFVSTRPKDVFACLGHAGPPKSLKEMQAGIAREAKRRHARNRY